MAKLLLILLSACAPTVGRVTLATSTAALACDWLQTRQSAVDGWPDLREANPILGPKPDAASVDAYFFTVALTNVVLYALLPRSVDWVIPSAVTAVQLRTIRGNWAYTRGPCGL